MEGSSREVAGLLFRPWDKKVSQVEVDETKRPCARVWRPTASSATTRTSVDDSNDDLIPRRPLVYDRLHQEAVKPLDSLATRLITSAAASVVSPRRLPPFPSPSASCLSLLDAATSLGRLYLPKQASAAAVLQQQALQQQAALQHSPAGLQLAFQARGPSQEGFLVPRLPLELLQTRKRPKKYKCEQCQASFSNNGQLRGHIRIHTGERPFRCDQADCHKSFTRNEELTRHKRIHTGLKPFLCPLPACAKPFGRKDHLKKHLKTHTRPAVMGSAGGPFRPPFFVSTAAASGLRLPVMDGFSLQR